MAEIKADKKSKKSSLEERRKATAEKYAGPPKSGSAESAEGISFVPQRKDILGDEEEILAPDLSELGAGGRTKATIDRQAQVAAFRDVQGEYRDIIPGEEHIEDRKGFLQRAHAMDEKGKEGGVSEAGEQLQTLAGRLQDYRKGQRSPQKGLPSGYLGKGAGDPNLSRDSRDGGLDPYEYRYEDGAYRIVGINLDQLPPEKRAAAQSAMNVRIMPGTGAFEELEARRSGGATVPQDGQDLSLPGGVEGPQGPGDYPTIASPTVEDSTQAAKEVHSAQAAKAAQVAEATEPTMTERIAQGVQDYGPSVARALMPKLAAAYDAAQPGSRARQAIASLDPRNITPRSVARVDRRGIPHVDDLVAQKATYDPDAPPVAQTLPYDPDAPPVAQNLPYSPDAPPVSQKAAIEAGGDPAESIAFKDPAESIAFKDPAESIAFGEPTITPVDGEERGLVTTGDLSVNPSALSDSEFQERYGFSKREAAASQLGEPSGSSTFDIDQPGDLSRAKALSDLEPSGSSTFDIDQPGDLSANISQEPTPRPNDTDKTGDYLQGVASRAISPRGRNPLMYDDDPPLDEQTPPTLPTGFGAPGTNPAAPEFAGFIRGEDPNWREGAPREGAIHDGQGRMFDVIPGTGGTMLLGFDGTPYRRDPATGMPVETTPEDFENSIFWMRHRANFPGMPEERLQRIAARLREGHKTGDDIRNYLQTFGQRREEWEQYGTPISSKWETESQSRPRDVLGSTLREG